MNTYQFHDQALVQKAQYGFLAIKAVCLVLTLSGGLLYSQQQRASIAQLEHTITRAETLPKSSDRHASVFLQAEDPNIAQTRLQTQVQELAASHGIEIEVIRATELRDEGRMIALGLNVKGVVGEAELAPFLTALSQTEPRILVEKVDIRRARLLSRRDKTRKLAVSFGFATLMQK